METIQRLVWAGLAITSALAALLWGAPHLLWIAGLSTALYLAHVLLDEEASEDDDNDDGGDSPQDFGGAIA